MAALDFPASPSTGDRYPTPAVAGKPQYSWDGEKWTTASGSTTTAPPATALPLMDAATAVVGVTTKYAREDHVHPKIYAAPLDALAYSGLQVNGSMEVSQENGITNGSDGFSPADGWRYSMSIPGLGASGNSNSTAYEIGFTRAVNMAVQTPVASPAGGTCDVRTVIEGHRISRLSWGYAIAKPVTIGFWTKHTRSGLYSVAVRNSPTTHSYVTTYTQVADVWQYNVLTIPGNTTGSWAVINTAGMLLAFSMAPATANTAPTANTWNAGNFTTAPGQINAVAATSDIFRITGVVVLPGIEAPSAERSPLIMRPYDQELLTCQRYFYNGVPNLRGFVNLGSATLLNRVGCNHPVVMRAAPTHVMTNPLPIYDGNTTSTISTLAQNTSTTRVLEFEAVSTAAMTVNRAFVVYQGGGGNLNVDARL